MLENQSKPFIFDLDILELENVLGSWGEPGYRSKQIWNGLYKQLWRRPTDFSTLHKSLREKINNNFSFTHLDPVSVVESSDGDTQKTLFRLPDGFAIEAVLMGYKRRRTLCISSQAGCALGCTFCATGQIGFQRNLSSGEIVEQVIYYARYLMSIGEQITNVVFMGMGEPFHNYDATISSIERLNHPEGINLGARRFTISTVGLVPAIRRFASEKRQINLAVSLHAVSDELRSSLLPINRRYPLDDLLDACVEYIKKTRRRITFEYALIQGVNDSPAQANELATRLQTFILNGVSMCHVNVIPLNSTEFYNGNPTSRQDVINFASIISKRNIPSTIRVRRGIDIQAGCGQLAAKSNV